MQNVSRKEIMAAEMAYDNYRSPVVFSIARKPVRAPAESIRK
jgi:hypothetical protein